MNVGERIRKDILNEKQAAYSIKLGPGAKGFLAGLGQLGGVADEFIGNDASRTVQKLPP